MTKVANNTIIAETVAEARVMAGSKSFWVVLLGASLLIGLTGPFGTFDALAMPERTIYWLFVVTTTFWLGYLLSFAVATYAEGYDISPVISIGIGAAAASPLLAAWLAGLHVVVFATPFWTDALHLLPYVAVITVAVAAGTEALAIREIGPASHATPTSKPAWLDQLPAHLGRDLILLHAQDHYVRAQTELGETLIRIRFQDAVDDLGDYGVRLHRSWWVARDAIKAYRYRNGAPIVVLQNGLELPVGRTYRRAVRQALG